MAECLMVYFINAKGKISLPPDFTTPAPPGYERRECHSLNEVEHVERCLNQEARDRLELEEQNFYSPGYLAMREDIRRRMSTTIASSCTSEYERDFCRHWILCRDERRREHHKKIFEQHQAFVELLHFDKPRNPEEVMGESL